MSYEVTAQLVVLAPAVTDGEDESGNAGPRYFYQGAVIPTGFNDERCDELVKEGMLEKVKAEKAPAGSAKS